MATIWDQVKGKLAHKNEYGHDQWSGYVTVGELRDMIRHHACRDVTVSTCTSYIMALPLTKYARAKFLADEWVDKRIERLREMTGREPEASVTVYEQPRPSGTTYTVLLHGMYAFTDDERESYFAF